MLAIVTEFLRAQGLLDEGVKPIYTISVAQPNALNIRARVSSDCFFHVKMKTLGTLPDEYDRHRSAHATFPRQVPEPLGRATVDLWDISAFRGVEHRRLRPGDLGRGRRDLPAQTGEFFELSARQAQRSQPADENIDLVIRFRDRTNDPVCGDILSTALRSERLHQLPSIRQHGDLVTVNMGMSDSGLVVFDWEDFGRVALPGLDLCTLIASDLLFDADALRRLADPARVSRSTYASLLERSCPALQLTPTTFSEQLALYLAIFFIMKSEPGNYGGAIADTVRRALYAVWH